MISMKTAVDYWFFIEPYVFVGIANKSVLLYNTLDGVSLESEKNEVIDLFREILKVENCGVLLLTNERYEQPNINEFIQRIREKYMGDVIDVSLSKGKPVQLLPYFNFPDKLEIYKRHNFSPRKNVLENLSEISIHVDTTTNISKLICFLLSIPGNPTFNIIGDIGKVPNYNELLSYLNQYPSPKYILCYYDNMISLNSKYNNNFSYKISIRFPLNMHKWNRLEQILFSNDLPVEYIFDVMSNDDCSQVEQIINQFKIDKYRLNPIYTGNNIRFFEDYIFLNKEDILSAKLTIKDFFTHQAINVYDYGKINITPNGDVYANLNHPLLGNIYSDSIYDIVQKEIDEGKSWFRIRNQAPCNDCVYQWLCPSPSSYEIYIRRSNLCHVSDKVDE